MLLQDENEHNFGCYPFRNLCEVFTKSVTYMEPPSNFWGLSSYVIKVEMDLCHHSFCELHILLHNHQPGSNV